MPFASFFFAIFLLFIRSVSEGCPKDVRRMSEETSEKHRRFFEHNPVMKRISIRDISGNYSSSNMGISFCFRPQRYIKFEE